MSEPWWGREAGPNRKASLTAAGVPILLPAAAADISAAVSARIDAFTPSWTNRAAGDPGVALIRLFGDLAAPVLRNLNNLPAKTMVEFFDLAGISPLPATAAETLLEFQVSNAAPQSVLIPAGFQVGASPAGGSGDLVIFETASDLYAAPATVAAMVSEQGGLSVEIDTKAQQSDSPTPFAPFGASAVAGQALYIGLDSPVAPAPQLSLGVQLAAAAGAPPPASSGGSVPAPSGPVPVLAWEVFDGAAYQPAELLKDETGGLLHSGIVVLGAPRRWDAGLPPELDASQPMRWLRLRIAYGRFATAPSLLFIRINMVRAQAARTISNEALEPVPNSSGRQFQLSQTPVLPGSLTLRVDDGGVDPATGAEISGGTGQIWTEADSLADALPDDQVYLLDPLTGVVSFGDGNQGALVPPGFRNVVAESYRVGGGSSGAVDAKAASTPIASVPFFSAVANPLKASGGTDRESADDALRRAPQEIRARGRAVTTADYALLAMRAQGAQVKRAQAIGGFHPSYPGASIAGVVGVLVVPPETGDGPPIPTGETLEAVATSLAHGYAPAGVDVVVGAPRYHTVRAEMAIVLKPGASEAETIVALLDAVNQYFDPLEGGDDGLGWPFGGTLRYFTLLRRLISTVSQIQSMPRLNLVIDGVSQPGCADYPIEPDALFWPVEHEVVVLSEDA